MRFAVKWHLKEMTAAIIVMRTVQLINFAHIPMENDGKRGRGSDFNENHEVLGIEIKRFYVCPLRNETLQLQYGVK